MLCFLRQPSHCTSRSAALTQLLTPYYIAGNETSIAAGSDVAPGTQIQGDSQFRMSAQVAAPADAEAEEDVPQYPAQLAHAIIWAARAAVLLCSAILMLLLAGLAAARWGLLATLAAAPLLALLHLGLCIALVHVAG